MSHERQGSTGRRGEGAWPRTAPAHGAPDGGTHTGMGDHRGVANMRGKETVRDMVLSMAAIGVVVAVIYVFIPHNEDADPVKPVSYQVELLQARRDAPFPVAAPVWLSKDWRPTSVTNDAKNAHAGAWHLGFIDPPQQTAADEQGHAPARREIAAIDG